MIWAMTTHNRAWFTWIQEQSNKYLQNAELEALEIRIILVNGEKNVIYICLCWLNPL